MKCVIICDEGCEDLIAQELEQQFSTEVSNISHQPTIVEFSTADNEEGYKSIAKICYQFQGAIKVLTECESFTCEKSLEQATQHAQLAAKNVDEALKNNLFTYEKIKVSCVRKGNHDFKSVDFAKEISKTIAKEKKRDFKTPDIEVLAYIKDDKGYVGIDIAGRNLAKRDYKIFIGSSSLRATVAFNTLLFAEYNPKKTLVDPFMGSGTIPLEAGLFASNTSPFHYTKEKFLFTQFIPTIDWKRWFEELDKKANYNKQPIYGYDSLLKFLKFSQKNAKIAGIHKVVNLSKVEIDWIDTKMEEKSVDIIVTHPPSLTEQSSKTKIMKLYKDLFHRSRDILKNNGTITIIATEQSMEGLKEAATTHSFKIYKERKIFEGQQEFYIATFVKNKEEHNDQ